MRRAVSLIILVVLPPMLLVGCGSFANIVSPPWLDGGPNDYSHRFYGGVKADVRFGTESIKNAINDELPRDNMPIEELERQVLSRTTERMLRFTLGAGLLLVDLPLSAIADTITLPIIIPVAASQEKAMRDLNKELADKKYGEFVPVQPK